MSIYPDAMTTRRARTLLERVLWPAIYTDRVPLDIGVFQSAEPISHAQAMDVEYRPAELGFAWGPVWSTAWFRLRGSVPDHWTGSFRLLFDTGTEALCWWDGTPYQGVELHRRDVKLPETVRPGSPLTIYLEAACNHMLGVGTDYGDVSRIGDFPARRGGLLQSAHLALHHPEREAMAHDLDVLLQLVEHLPEASSRRRHAAEGLRQACNAMDAYALDDCVTEVRAICGEALQTAAEGSANTVHCVGHAHIDLAWLWPIRETRRKAARSFSTVLRYMERHPSYRFVQSQPQLYEWVREDYPRLFAEIQQRAREGRWEAAGAMWVEADCNIPSGESLTRQVLLGCRYFEEHFGGEQRYLWLPDVFGYSAALPQILRRAGISSFFTQKISWNQFNKFPHHSFNWIGIDGSSIPTHFFPSDTYNASNTPAEMIRGDSQYRQAAELPAWLQAYGYGDGGGGPTEAMIAFVDRMTDCAGVPRLHHASVQSYADRLVESSGRLPNWDGELYLERHRGTYTSHASLKRSNREGELALKRLELLQVLCGAHEQQRQRTDQLWKDFLLNQFHDIIPGSSIAWVNREARELYETVANETQKMMDEIIHRLRVSSDRTEVKPREVLFALNTRSRGEGGLMEIAEDVSVGPATVQATTSIDGRRCQLVSVDGIGSPGLTEAQCQKLAEGDDLRIDGKRRQVENAHLRAELDSAGRVLSLVHKVSGREMLPSGAVANQLMLYEDRPMAQEAWAVDVFYRERGEAVDDAAEMRVVEDGPWRVALEFRRPLGRSSQMVQRVEVGRDEDWLTFNTRVEWSEERTLLRTLHPIDVRTDHATFEIQYGHVRRPNHVNTSWDVARFESPAQRWTDLSEPGFGVTLFNDCKYGHSAMGNVLGMSLLRGPREPDETADRGTHYFRYGLRPHGDFDAADATRVAEVFNESIATWRLKTLDGQAWPELPFTLRGPHRSATAIEAIKPAEDGKGTIVRLREVRGGRGFVELEAVGERSFVETDLLERALAEQPTTRLSVFLRPFEVRTFLLR